MTMHDTTDPYLVDRCSKALRDNKKIAENFDTPTGQTTITGKVQSVALDLQSSPKRWTITIIPE